MDKSIEDYLRTRIAELNSADIEFCKKRWDRNEPEPIRRIFREQSNNVKFAMQELESILEHLGLPRFKTETA